MKADDTRTLYPQTPSDDNDNYTFKNKYRTKTQEVPEECVNHILSTLFHGAVTLFCINALPVCHLQLNPSEIWNLSQKGYGFQYLAYRLISKEEKEKGECVCWGWVHGKWVSPVVVVLLLLLPVLVFLLVLVVVVILLVSVCVGAVCMVNEVSPVQAALSPLVTPTSPLQHTIFSTTTAMHITQRSIKQETNKVV